MYKKSNKRNCFVETVKGSKHLQRNRMENRSIFIFLLTLCLTKAQAQARAKYLKHCSEYLFFILLQRKGACGVMYNHM